MSTYGYALFRTMQRARAGPDTGSGPVRDHGQSSVEVSAIYDVACRLRVERLAIWQMGAKHADPLGDHSLRQVDMAHDLSWHVLRALHG
jgi:hypothetical protein